MNLNENIKALMNKLCKFYQWEMRMWRRILGIKIQ